MKNAIENDCDFLILILDSYSVKSDWVKKEIDWALEKERKIKRTFLLTIVTEEEAIPLVQNKDVLSKDLELPIKTLELIKSAAGLV